MKGITYCGACADYDLKKHRCKRGAMQESNPQDKFFDDCPLPTVVQVVHGQWILRHIGAGHYWECSVCHTNPCIYVTEHTKFCPNCGARMDEGED